MYNKNNLISKIFHYLCAERNNKDTKLLNYLTFIHKVYNILCFFNIFS